MRPCEDGGALNQGTLCTTVSSIDEIAVSVKQRLALELTVSPSFPMTSSMKVYFFVLVSLVSVLDNLTST